MSIGVDGRPLSRPSQPRHAKNDLTFRRRLTGFAIALLFVLLVALSLAWVGSRALMVKSELEQAELYIDQARVGVDERDFAALPGTFSQAQVHVVAARAISEDPLWSIAESVPKLGPNLEALRRLTEFLDDAMRASEPLVELAPQFDPATLVPHDGRVPVEPFVNAAEVLPPFVDEFHLLREQLDSIPVDGTVPQVQSAKARFVDAFDRAEGPLEQAVPLVELMPTLLGVDGPRTYVVMFENNAELRSLGGTALSFVEVGVDQGAISLDETVAAGFSNFPNHTPSIVPVPEGFDEIYPVEFGRFIANATLRPSAHTAAEIVQAEWLNRSGKEIDAVVSMDGPTLALLLDVTGPVTLSTGEEVGGDNVIDLLFNEVYQRYNSGDPVADNRQQDVIYGETVSKTFELLMAGGYDPVELVRSMAQAAEADGFWVRLSDAEERATLEATPFAAQGLPVNTPTTVGMGLFLNDQAGAKLNYYLGAVGHSTSGVCSDDGRQTHRMSLELTNTLTEDAVAGLSSSESGTIYLRNGLAKGVQRFVVFAYLPVDATLVAATVNGAPRAPTGTTDEGQPVQVLWIDVPPGSTGTVTVEVLMDAPGERDLQASYTPTLHGTQVSTGSLDCATVGSAPVS